MPALKKNQTIKLATTTTTTEEGGHHHLPDIPIELQVIEAAGREWTLEDVVAYCDDDDLLISKLLVGKGYYFAYENENEIGSICAANTNKIRGIIVGVENHNDTYNYLELKMYNYVDGSCRYIIFHYRDKGKAALNRTIHLVNDLHDVQKYQAIVLPSRQRHPDLDNIYT